jgi:hypothetical protein
MDIEQLKRDLERVIRGGVLQSEEPLHSVLLRLDAFSSSPEASELLQHYLSQRSYVKALACLQDPSLPHRI